MQKIESMNPTGAVAIVLALAIAGGAAADEVRLRAAVRLAGADPAVRLGEVADLEGPLAERHADLVIGTVTDAREVLEIPVAEVRRRLDEAGVHWGRVHLSGRSVVVRPRLDGAAGAPRAMTAVSLPGGAPPPDAPDEPEPAGVLASSMVAEGTLRGDLARFIAGQLQVDPGALRLELRPGDGELLSTSSAELRFELQPFGRLDNDLVSLAVRAWRDGRVQWDRTVKVAPTVRVDALRVVQPVHRGGPVPGTAFTTETQWLPPRAAAELARPDDLRGATAAERLAAGLLLRRAHLEAEPVVRRGDLVMVRCLVGGLAVSLAAEAREDGAEGDRIPFRKLNERNTFPATVTGPGEAVVDLSRRAGERVAASAATPPELLP